jgi:hypothetical protein
MAALQMQLPRTAQLAVRNAAALPSQRSRLGASSLPQPVLLRRMAQTTVVSAKLAKSEPKGPPPAVSVSELQQLPAARVGVTIRTFRVACVGGA